MASQSCVCVSEYVGRGTRWPSALWSPSRLSSSSVQTHRISCVAWKCFRKCYKQQINDFIPLCVEWTSIAWPFLVTFALSCFPFSGRVWRKQLKYCVASVPLLAQRDDQKRRLKSGYISDRVTTVQQTENTTRFLQKNTFPFPNAITPDPSWSLCMFEFIAQLAQQLQQSWANFLTRGLWNLTKGAGTAADDGVFWEAIMWGEKKSITI